MSRPAVELKMLNFRVQGRVWPPSARHCSKLISLFPLTYTAKQLRLFRYSFLNPCSGLNNRNFVVGGQAFSHVNGDNGTGMKKDLIQTNFLR